MVGNGAYRNPKHVDEPEVSKAPVTPPPGLEGLPPGLEDFCLRADWRKWQ